MQFLQASPLLLAHVVTDGMGVFPAALLHPLVTPAHVLNIVVLGLWLGRQAPLQIKKPLAAFAVSLASGLLTTVLLPKQALPSLVPTMLGMAMVSAAVVASTRELPMQWRLCWFAAVGLTLGLDSGIDQTDRGFILGEILTGIFLSFIVFLHAVAFYLSLLPAQKWSQTAIRIAASWIAAIGLLMMAFFIRPMFH